MLDKAAAREIAAKYADEVKKVLNPDAIVLFGSFVNGTFHEWSDIDVAIIVNNFQGNWLETSSMLYGLTWDVSVNIEPHLLDESCDRSGFVEHVMKTGEFIYKSK